MFGEMLVLATLIQNAALLLAMMVVFELITSREQVHSHWPRQALAGIILGGLSIGLMIASLQLETGIIFDTRSVLLSLSGLFFGPIPTVFAMTMATVYRLWQGGFGTWPGIGLILASGGVGILWRHYRPGRLAEISVRELYGFGVVVHLVMLSMMLTLPWEAARRALSGVGLPVLVVYPLATIALGWLLVNRVRRETATADMEETYRQLEESRAATLNIMETLKVEVRSRQAKEAELRRITIAVEQAGEAVVITDPEGTIQYINPAFTVVTGYGREEILGQNSRILKSGRQDDAFYRVLWETISGGTVWHGDLINTRKDGTSYTEEVTISPVKDESGRILNFVAVKRDITERKQMEENLVIALEEKTRLVSELYHRTNNNMQVIQALLRYRLSARPELPAAQFVEDVIGQIQSMAQAQQELFRAGQLSRIDLSDYLPSVVQLVQDRYPDKRGQVSISLDLQPHFVLLDSAVPLGLVVTELVTNAFRHAFSGDHDERGTDEITITCTASEVGEIEVGVCDNGMGWSPAGGSVGPGGGLGLAAALVEQQLGGTIIFDGSAGTTSVVRFRDNRYEERV